MVSLALRACYFGWLPMGSTWLSFFSEEKNRKILNWLGDGAVVVAGGKRFAVVASAALISLQVLGDEKAAAQRVSSESYGLALAGEDPQFRRGGVILRDQDSVEVILGSEYHQILDKLWQEVNNLPINERAFIVN